MIIKKDTTLIEVLALASPCQCDKCNHGCKFGSGILAKEDLKKISDFLGRSVSETEKEYLEEIEQFNSKKLRPRLLKSGKPYGQCVFFDGSKCKIHSVKPLQCKTSINCKDYGEDLAKWFMLNHLIDVNDAESIRQYAIYLKTHSTLPGGELQNLINDPKKLGKMLKFDIL
jgi:Fe-S-cluster containining protein